MSDCEQEMCPQWGGHECLCLLFGLDPEAPPTGGVFTVTVPNDPEEPR